MSPHGTPQRYWSGDRCSECRAAVAEYQRDRLVRKLIPVDEAAPLARELVRRFGGTRRVPGFQQRTLQRIANGSVRFVRMDTYDRLIEVAR